MGLPLYLVDAFAERPFAGNPAAVCLLEEPRDDQWMQSVAEEMKQAETAFLVRRDAGFSLRWFTPTVEVDLCGHATLASAHVLWESGSLAHADAAQFWTRSGLLTARKAGDWIEMDFPSEPPERCDAPVGVERAVGLRIEWVGRNRMDYLVQVGSENALRTLSPDIESISRLDSRGLIVTARSDSNRYDFVSRFFAPQSGIDEDPVTGSAHCALAPFWSERLERLELTGYQASQRGGTVRMELKGDRVMLRGRAVTIIKGELNA